MVKQRMCALSVQCRGLAAAKHSGSRTQGDNPRTQWRSWSVWEPARSYPEVQTKAQGSLSVYDKPCRTHIRNGQGPQVHAYLTDYAKDHGLMQRMRLNTTVVGMARRNSACRAGRWKSGIRMAA